jgi:hypothetical protein
MSRAASHLDMAIEIRMGCSCSTVDVDWLSAETAAAAGPCRRHPFELPGESVPISPHRAGTQCVFVGAWTRVCEERQLQSRQQ